MVSENASTGENPWHCLNPLMSILLSDAKSTSDLLRTWNPVQLQSTKIQNVSSLNVWDGKIVCHDTLVEAGPAKPPTVQGIDFLGCGVFEGCLGSVWEEGGVLIKGS